LSEYKQTIIQFNKSAACGKSEYILYAVEKHICSECLHFKEGNKIIDTNLPSCEKKLMAVTRDMYVYYKIHEGTCFQPRETIRYIYYLPGDIGRVFLPIDILQFYQLWESLRILKQQLAKITQPILDNLAKELREMANLLPFKEDIKELESKNLHREPLPRPLKAIKAINLNEHVNKIIYHHIRSNC